jgi:hypothetical protein
MIRRETRFAAKKLGFVEEIADRIAIRGDGSLRRRGELAPAVGSGRTGRRKKRQEPPV